MCYRNSNNNGGLIWVLLLSSSFALSVMLSCCHGGRIPITGLLPVTLDQATNLYKVEVQLGGTAKNLTLDLSNSNLWTNKCSRNAGSKPVSCNSRVCAMSATCNAYVCRGKSCTNKGKACSVFVTNPATAETRRAKLWRGKFHLAHTDSAKHLLVPDFPFACAPGDGAFGLSRAQIAAPKVLSRHFRFPPIFTYCLDRYGYDPSPLFFGGTEDHRSLNYSFLYDVQILAEAFRFTPILTSKSAPDEYFLQINNISVGGDLLPINPSLLSINEKSGRGGTRISTSERYTRLEPSIYRALSQAFVKKAIKYNLFQVAAVPPFQTCFNASRGYVDRIGYYVPVIALAFRKENASDSDSNWEMDVLNNMVNVGNTGSILCLAFLETKPSEKRAIVVGTFQQHDRLLRFDLKSNVLGFTRNLLRGDRTRCSNFNFTAAS